MRHLIDDFCKSKKISYTEFKQAVTSQVEPTILGNEVYETADIRALLAQPGAIAIRPVNLNLTGKNMTLFVAVKRTGPANLGAEHGNMIEKTHYIALPQ